MRRWVIAAEAACRPAVGLLVLVLAMGFPTSSSATGDAQAAPDAFRELQLGYVAFDAGDFEGAMSHYAKALEGARGVEQRFNALLGLGSAAFELERYDEAMAAFEEAHSLKPGEVGATFSLGVTCRKMGELERAVTLLAEAAIREPGQVDPLVELGIAYGALGRHRDAERVCRDALDIDPDHVEARLGLAVALFHQDLNAEAAVEFRRVLERQPDNPRAHYGLGLALLYAGDRQGAVDEIIELEKLSPKLSDELHGWVFPDD